MIRVCESSRRAACHRAVLTAAILLGVAAGPRPAAGRPAQSTLAESGVRVTIGAAVGGHLDVVRVPVELASGGETVAAVDVTVRLPEGGAELLRNGRGDPACTVNRDIHKDAAVFRFLPNGCTAEGGVPCRALRAVILSLYDVDPIPDGLLFSCRVHVSAAELGVVPLPCERAAAASPDQRLLPVDCYGGGVIVQSLATPTPTFTPTRTWTAPPFVSPTPTPAVRLRIGTSAGRPGDLVAVPVRLSADAPVVGALVDLVLPNGGAEFAVTGVGLPDCAVNPEIDKDDTAFGFWPFGCTPGLDCAAVRAVVLSLRDVDPLPADVELFSCRLRIADRASGIVPLVCGSAQTSPPQARQLADNYPTTCSGGGLIVGNVSTDTPTSTHTATRTPTRTPTTSFTATASPTPSAFPTGTATFSATATPSDTPTAPPAPSATATPSPTATESPSPSATVTATTTHAPTATPIRCLGDCNGDGRISVDELVRGVAIALGNVPFAACAAFDRNGDEEVAVHELISAVNAALTGCGPPGQAGAGRP